MHHCRFLPLLLLASVLSSCQSFDSEHSRQNTRFYLRDSTERTGELLGVARDSVFMIDAWDAASQPIAIHYSELDVVVFLNEGSPIAGGLIGMVSGTFVGALVGAAVGDVHYRSLSTHSLPSRSLPSAPLNLHPNINLGAILVTVPFGALVGLMAGVDASTDKVVYIDDAADLKRLMRFARHKSPAEFMMYRGY